MADLEARPEPAEPLVYRPLSGLAMAGFALGILFAVLVGISTLAALKQGAPVFLPFWLYFGMPVLAACVCLLALGRIRNSEGTIAGAALARWGLGISVFLGVTYVVYTWVTGLALAKQADDFLQVKSDDSSGFFPRLMNANKSHTDLNQAFLLTIPATSRGGSKADNEERMATQHDQPTKDGEAGNLTSFSRHPLVLLLSKNADGMTIEPLGVVEWKYDLNSYHVTRNYRFTSPEWVVEATIPAQSTEGIGEGEQRKWFVPMNRMPRFTSIMPTPLGKKRLDLRANSKIFLDKWRSDLTERLPIAAYNEADTDWTKILPKSTPQREFVKKALAEVFSGARKLPGMFLFGDDRFVNLQITDGHVHVHQPLKILLTAGGSGMPTYFIVESDIELSTVDPGDLADLVTQPLPWQIVKIRLTRAAPAEKAAPVRRDVFTHQPPIQ